MVRREWIRKHENFIGTALLLLFICVVTGIRYDYYFDLNDDVLMKDILAGVYTGVPEGHNIQMLWPVSAFISFFYRIGRGLPWYGIFLCVCQFGSIGLIAHRSLQFCKSYVTKGLLLITEGLLVMGLLLEHLVSAQYTITCTLLAAAAAFLFVTTDSTLPAKTFIRKNAGVILLVSVAFLIRSEMLALVLPLICGAGAVKWGSEEKIFTKENAVKYLPVIGGILGGLFLGQAVHMIAYSSTEWKTFTEYFDNRTELYDFQILPEYEPHKEFYESIGLTESERELLDNYNFGLDEEIDEKLLGEIAAYAAKNRGEEEPFFVNLKQSLGNYARRTLTGPAHNESDYPWNVTVILGYLAVLAAALFNEKKKLWVNFLQIIWKLALIGAIRSSLWMFIIMRHRYPARITHSLYLMELCILGAMLFMEWSKLKGERRRQIVGTGAAGCFTVLAVWMLPFSVKTTDEAVRQKAENNIPYEQLYAYLGKAENKENFYFIDVYSSVSYTEKMFVNVDNSLDNYDIMGGWACKSPLQKKKLAAFGITNMEEALLTMEHVFYVQETGADFTWLYRYYADHATPIEAELVETVGDGFEIFKLVPAEP